MLSPHRFTPWSRQPHTTSTLPPHGPSGFPSSFPLTQDRPSFSFPPPTWGLGPQQGTEAAPRHCSPHGAFPTTYPSPCSPQGGQTGESDQLPVSVSGEASQEALGEGMRKQTITRLLSTPSAHQALPSPGPACLPGAAGQVEAGDGPGHSSHTRLPPLETNRMWEVKPRHGYTCLLD